MDVLVCAATPMELAAYSPAPTGGLVTGAGIPRALAFVMETAHRERPDCILNIGIAGAYPGSGLWIGDIVIGASEVYGDVGLELPDAPGFQSAGETPWGAFYGQQLTLAQLPEFAGAPVLPGCTVNQCTGTDETGRLRERLFCAAFETMEGAAVAHAGQLLGIPVMEIRAISNIAARRDMRPENIRLALDRLAAYFRQLRENPLA